MEEESRSADVTSLTIKAKFQLAYFGNLGPKTILFHPKNARFHSNFNHCGSADPHVSNLKQWPSCRK